MDSEHNDHLKEQAMNILMKSLIQKLHIKKPNFRWVSFAKIIA